MNDRKSTKTRSPLHSLAAARPLTGLRLRDLAGPVAVGSTTLLASLTLTVVSAWLITRAWQMPPVMDLTVAVTAVRALGISRAVFRYCDRLVSHRLALRCAGTARVQAYRLLASAPAARAATLTRGQVLTSLTTDIEAVADVIVRSVIPALVFVVTGIAAVGIAAALSVPAAGVLLVGLLIAGVLAPWAVGSSVRTADRRRANSTGRYVAAIDRVLTDSPALRIRGELEHALDDAKDAAHDLTSATESGAPARATGAGLGVLASAATVLGVLVVAVLAYGDGSHSPQWLGVLVLLATASFEAASALPDAAEAATRASGAADRLTVLVGGTGDTGGLGGRGDAVPASPPTPIDLRPDLRMEKLRYGRDQELGYLDLDLTFGDQHTLVAASGTGKTTLLMTMAGLLPALEGRVTLDGRDITDLTPEDLHRIVAYLPEDAHIFATTVRDNLAVGAPEAPDDLMLSTLEATGLSDWVSGLPDGLDTLLKSGADSLSGGQRRRLLLTRMLLTDAPILLLDEPFEHMDAAGSEHLEEVLHATSLPGRRPHRTIVVVRHPRPRT